MTLPLLLALLLACRPGMGSTPPGTTATTGNYTDTGGTEDTEAPTVDTQTVALTADTAALTTGGTAEPADTSATAETAVSPETGAAETAEPEDTANALPMDTGGATDTAAPGVDTAPPFDTAAPFDTGAPADTGEGDTGAPPPDDTAPPCPFEAPEPDDTGTPAARRVGAFDVATEAEATFLGEQGDTGASYPYGAPFYLGDEAGADVEGIGDIDADGYDDLAILATRPNQLGGKAYVVRGPATGVIDLSNADASFEPGLDLYAIARVGDLDGDGRGDLAIIGSFPDKIQVFPGPAVTGVIDPLATLLTIETLDPYQIPLASGDLDGDGIDDLVVGEPYYSPAPLDSFGRVAIVRGGSTGSIDPATLPDTVVGTSPIELMGYRVAVADVTGDGLPDVLAGSYPAEALGVARSGDVLLFAGPVGGSLTRSDAVTQWVGEATGDVAANPVAPGDLDGDGYEDLVVGAPGYAAYLGAAYVFYGPVAECGARFVTDAPATLTGGADMNLTAVQAPGDMDGDGRADLLFRALYETWLGYGPFFGESEVTVVGEYAQLDSTLGSEHGASAGDVNGDGLADLIFGSPDADAGGGNDSGAAYLILGGF